MVAGAVRGPEKHREHGRATRKTISIAWPFQDSWHNFQGIGVFLYPSLDTCGT